NAARRQGPGPPLLRASARVGRETQSERRRSPPLPKRSRGDLGCRREEALARGALAAPIVLEKAVDEASARRSVCAPGRWCIPTQTLTRSTPWLASAHFSANSLFIAPSRGAPWYSNYWKTVRC